MFCSVSPVQVDNKMASDEIPLILNDLLQVPLYQLSKQFRANQKVHEQGASSALKAIKDLAQRASTKESSGESVDPEKAIAALDKISAKLKEIRAQTRKTSQDMQTSLESLTFRLAMRNSPLLQESHDNKRARSSNETVYSSERMLELAVISNHLLRTNRFETFKSFCNESDCEFLSQDAETFQTHAGILVSLIEKHDAEPALTWCAENRSVLKKMNSSLEFELKLRQFLEIVKQGKPKEAVLFARKNLAQNAHDERMRKAMGTLVYPPRALAESPYRALMEDERWNDLANLFAVERNATLNLNPVSPLEIVVKVGLAAARTISCRPDGIGRAAGCPACQPSLGTLALSLPRTLRERSALVCRITGNPMDEPLVLPNGQAYSKVALEQMAQSRGDGKVLCPVTHQEFYLKDAKRAFVL